MGLKKIKLVDRIYLDLLSKIKGGEYENGQKLPTEKQLCVLYQVSRITVQNAVLRLVDDGLVSRNKRGGTVVGKNAAYKNRIIIPIVLPYVDDMIHGFLYGAQKKALEYGYTVKAYNSNNDYLKEKSILQKFASHPPRALIIYPCSQFANIPVISRLYAKNVPMVFVDREIIGTDCPLVVSNNAQAMFELTCKIIKKGYKKLSYYGYFDDSLSPAKDRLNGFCMAHAICKLPLYDEFLITSGDSKLPNTARSIDDILKSNKIPEVICCLHDYLALEVIQKAQALGLRVPEDLGVTGFDNRIAPTLQTGLTTIEQNFYEIGVAAVVTAHELMNGEKPARRTKIKAQIIVRESVKNL